MNLSSYLAVQQLCLRPPIAFNLIADAVEECYPILFPVAAGELPQHLPSLLCKGRAELGCTQRSLQSQPTALGAFWRRVPSSILLWGLQHLCPQWGAAPQAELWHPTAQIWPHLHFHTRPTLPHAPEEQGSAWDHLRARCPLPSPSSPGLAKSYYYYYYYFLAFHVSAVDSSPRQEIPDIKAIPAPRRFLCIVQPCTRPHCRPTGRAAPSLPLQEAADGGSPPAPCSGPTKPNKECHVEGLETLRAKRAARGKTTRTVPPTPQSVDTHRDA